VIDENEAIRLQWQKSEQLYRSQLQGLPEVISANLPKDRKGLQKRLDLIWHSILTNPSTTDLQKSVLGSMIIPIQQSLENIARKRAERSARWNLILTIIASIAAVVAAVAAVISLKGYVK